MSAKWAGASGDYDPIHYDRSYVLKQKLPDIIVNGRLKIALLSQLMTNWIGPQGFLKKVGASHRGMDIIDDPVTCKGMVTKKYLDNGQHVVECKIWIENKKGEVTAPGNATVILP
jgi:acyl dehydratase